MDVHERQSMKYAAVLVISALLAGCGREQSRRPVLLEGAMPSEVERLAGRLDRAVTETVAGWTCWRGAIDGYPVVVCKTGKGAANTAAATAIAVDHYHPLAIINEGTAGGHD